MKTAMIRKVACAGAALIAIAAIVSACSSKKGGEEAGDPRCDEAIVPYEGYSTDEACKTMLDADDAGQVQTTGSVPVIMVPTSGATIAASASSLNITWTSSLDLDGDTFLFLPRAKSTTYASAPAHRDIAKTFLEFISPESIAWAHLPPVTGALHMIRIKGVTGQTAPFLAFTTRLHFAVTSSNLQPILATTSPMQIELTDAYLTENRIVTPSTDGPFRAADRPFHVQ